MKQITIKNREYKYYETQVLGEGGFGKVYLGQDSNNQNIAIKIIENMSEEILISQEKELKIVEDILTKTNDYEKEFIVQLIDYDIDMQNSKMVMIIEYCTLGDFEHYLTKNRELDEKKAKYLISQLIYSLKILRKIGIVHGDLKPSNILLNKSSNGKLQLKLTDFGCSRSINTQYNESIVIIGTPLYMSPQMLKNEPYTDKSDIWSIGILYYRMLFGKAPWPNAQNINDYIDCIDEQQPIKFYAHINPITKISKNFIESCLKCDEQDRIEWDELFEHELIKKEIDNLDKENSDYRDQLTERFTCFPQINTNNNKSFFDKSGMKSDHTELKGEYGLNEERMDWNTVLIQEEIQQNNSKDKKPSKDILDYSEETHDCKNESTSQPVNNMINPSSIDKSQLDDIPASNSPNQTVDSKLNKIESTKNVDEGEKANKSFDINISCADLSAETTNLPAQNANTENLTIIPESSLSSTFKKGGSSSKIPLLAKNNNPKKSKNEKQATNNKSKNNKSFFNFLFLCCSPGNNT